MQTTPIKNFSVFLMNFGLLLTALVSQAEINSGCTATPCLTPNQTQAEALFGSIETTYPNYFSKAKPTQTLQLGTDLAYIRNYDNVLSTGLATYQGGLWYTLGGSWNRYSSLDVGNQQFCNNHCWTLSAITQEPKTFTGNIVLGAPTDKSINVSILSPEQEGVAYVEYGTQSGQYNSKSANINLSIGKAQHVELSNLLSNTRYFYRVVFQATGSQIVVATPEYALHTARPEGSTFVFTLQADAHLDENSDIDIYRQTLNNVLADTPDFHIDLGDTFMCEKHVEPLSANSKPASDQTSVIKRYIYERGNFATITHTVPLFLVNGNHEGEQGWLLNGSEQNLSIWTTLARQHYFVNPLPNSFYAGDTLAEPWVGKRASWYAWQWGDAMFIVLDPYWNTQTKPGKDGWALTLGDRQYQWLQETLASSRASYKFVFIHNLVGGLDGQMRGGIEAAAFYEWGGQNQDGSIGFAQKRKNWAMPIHDLLVKHKVTAVFHGHDHLYAQQLLDGIVYQEVPQPSAKNFSNATQLAADYHYSSGKMLSSSGHLRVTVSPERVTSEYVRSWLPKNANAQRINRQIDDTWSVNHSGQMERP